MPLNLLDKLITRPDHQSSEPVFDANVSYEVLRPLAGVHVVLAVVVVGVGGLSALRVRVVVLRVRESG